MIQCRRWRQTLYTTAEDSLNSSCNRICNAVLKKTNLIIPFLRAKFHFQPIKNTKLTVLIVLFYILAAIYRNVDYYISFEKKI